MRRVVDVYQSVAQGSVMSADVGKANVLRAGVMTAAAAVVVVGHMYAIDWVGKRFREYVGQR